jgi:hypothetical protein
MIRSPWGWGCVGAVGRKEDTRIRNPKLRIRLGTDSGPDPTWTLTKKKSANLFHGLPLSKAVCCRQSTYRKCNFFRRLYGLNSTPGRRKNNIPTALTQEFPIIITLLALLLQCYTVPLRKGLAFPRLMLQNSD